MGKLKAINWRGVCCMVEDIENSRLQQIFLVHLCRIGVLLSMSSMCIRKAVPRQMRTASNSLHQSSCGLILPQLRRMSHIALEN